MNLITSILLMAPTEGGAEGGGAMNLLMIAMFIGVFYFFFIRPQMKKTKEERKYREGLKKGDKIITAGGIHGKIVQVNDTTFLVEVDNNVKLKFEKSSITLNGESTLAEKK